MNFSSQIQNALRAVKQRNYAYFVSLILLMSNIVLCIKIYVQEEHWVLIPQFSIDQTIGVSGSYYSDSYINQWAGSLARELLTVNPSTVQIVAEKVLKVSSTKHGQIKPHLESHIKEIVENNISTVFYEKECKINRDQKEVEVTGSFYTYFGREKAPLIETKTFAMGWESGVNGVLLVSKFEEKKEI